MVVCDVATARAQEVSVSSPVAGPAIGVHLKAYEQ